jgi:hypothetical protein
VDALKRIEDSDKPLRIEATPKNSSWQIAA